MAQTLIGPWKILQGPDEHDVPFYVIPFDKAGTCTGPRTQDALVKSTREATDVFLFSHGWNNDWEAATERYERFVEQFQLARRTHWDPPDREFRPVLAGVFWPSTALVAPAERAPSFAGSGATKDEQGEVLADLVVLADALGGAPPALLYDLAQRDQLGGDDARKLAEILAPALAGADEDLARPEEQVTPEELLAIRARVPPDDAPSTTAEPGGLIDEVTPSEPVSAGLFDMLNPRQVVRAATVLLMKDRAGRVGGNGVASLLRHIIDASSSSRVHLVGHSYGGKVVLSGLCQGAPPSRPVDSVLLLQPAMSALCFSPDVDGKGTPGGYRPALDLDRCRQPVLTTFSRHDVPLTQLFHWAVRRSSDLGEAVIAGAPPSRFAALGGFGPQGISSQRRVVDALSAPKRYELADDQTRILAIRADDVIGSHGAVENAATAWALLNQVSG